MITFLSQAKDVILEGCKVRGSWAYQNVTGGASTECSLSDTLRTIWLQVLFYAYGFDVLIGYHI